MLKLQNRWTQRLRALFCLIAVLLFEAPFARGVWISVSAQCCISDHCPIPGHHHKAQPAKEEMPLDCGHNMSHMADCKISCCKAMDENAISVAQFVMPDSQIALSLARGTPELARFVPQMISRSEKPLSPPPKLFLS